MSSFGQLIRENNSAFDKTFIFCYDNIGNITSVKTYAYTTDATPTGTYAEKTYTYDSTNKDRLVKFKPIYNVLWGKLSYDFALGAASAEIFLNGAGIYEKSAFYCYEIWALLEKGVERIITYV